jgi:hypothetical protein
VLLSGVLFFLSYYSGRSVNPQEKTRLAAVQLAGNISSLEDEFKSRFNDSTWRSIVDERSYWQELPELSKYSYEILLYRNDSVLFWTDNMVIPSQPPGSFEEGMSFQKFRNGYYLFYRRIIASSNPMEKFTLLVLAPVKYEFMTANSYLKPHFSTLFPVYNYFIVSATPEPGYEPVKDETGKLFFYVGVDAADYAGRGSLTSVLLFFAAALLFVLFLDQLLNLLPAGKWIGVRFVLLAAMFFGVYFFLSDKKLLPPGVTNWKIFTRSSSLRKGLPHRWERY